MTEGKKDYLGDMIAAYDEELEQWYHERVNPNPKTATFVVSRGDKIMAQGDLDKTENAMERLSKRFAMRAAIRALTDIPLGEIGVEEEDVTEEEDALFKPDRRYILNLSEAEEGKEGPADFDLTVIETNYAKETWARIEERLARIDEKLDQILGIWDDLVPGITELGEAVLATEEEEYEKLDDLNVGDGPLWGVCISTADTEKGCLKHREIEVDVKAPTAKEALIAAIEFVQLREGELFHTVHIGPPANEKLVAAAKALPEEYDEQTGKRPPEDGR